MSVNWTDIVAECGDYRTGFVAVFRRYEGQPTDEKDSRGRTVKVTIESFARHMGIVPNTLRRWIKTDSASVQPRSPRSKNDLTRDVTRAARHEPDAVVEGVMNAPSQTQDRIFHDLKLRRAGVDTSLPARKASQAATHEAVVEPIQRAMNAMTARIERVLVVSALNEAREDLLKIIEDGGLDAEGWAEINDAHEAFSITLAEARFAIS